MLTSPVKRFLLPFKAKKSRDPPVEEAAVFALAEQQRNRGGGLLSRQPQERLFFIARAAYPLWLFPKNNRALIFDGLNNSSYNAAYGEAPSVIAFMDNLQLNQRPRENYMTFLADNHNYFQQPLKEKHFTFHGLIADPYFKVEFGAYRKEATELTASTTTLLTPLLEENTINATLSELAKLQAFLKADAEKLPECQRFITKTTSQYNTELDYEAAAAKDEADAKIKAQEEFVKPQIAKLNKDYHHKIKQVTDGFDREIESQKKQKIKTEKTMASVEAKIHQYERDAKAAGSKGHEVYERHWKEKVKVTQKELLALKKEHKTIESTIKRLAKQKGHDASELTFELDSKIKLMRQPIAALEQVRNEKMLAYKQESHRLLTLEKPVLAGISKSMWMREKVNAGFEGLGIADSQLKVATLFYVPFYLVCYEMGNFRRYQCIAPSAIGSVDFSAKLKGALGMSKIKDLLTPRFPTIAALIGKVEMLAQYNSFLEGNLWSLGEKDNLLKSIDFQREAAEGLLILRREGWLSEHETMDLRSRLLG
jgi:hypothetical protein